MSKHTPGPWVVSGAMATDKLHVKGKETGHEWHYSSRAIFSGELMICRVEIYVGEGIVGYCSPQSHEEFLANARLIAQAPRLLEALTSIADRLEQIQYDHNICDGDLALAEARAAIAAATEGDSHE